MPNQSRSHLTGEVRPGILHPSVDLILPTRILPQYEATSRSNSLSLPKWLLLLTSHLLPAQECDFWSDHRYVKGGIVEISSRHCAQKHLWDDQRADLIKLRQCDQSGGLHWATIPSQLSRFSSPIGWFQHGVIPSTTSALLIHTSLGRRELWFSHGVRQ